MRTLDLDIIIILDYYTYDLSINIKIILVIAFLSSVISLAPVTSTTLASIDYSNTAVEESFRVLVTVTGMEGKRGEEKNNNSSIQVRYN